MTHFEHHVWRHVDEFLEDCRVLALDSTGRILCGTSIGLLKFDGRRYETFGRKQGLWPDATVTAITRGKDNRVWIGTQGGAIAALDGGNFQVLPVDDGSNTRVTALLVEPDGALLVGGDAGLNRVVGNSLQRLSSMKISALLRDRRGHVWVGTTNGLFLLQDDRIIPMQGLDGLDSARIAALSEDRQANLWIGSNKGITRFDGENVVTFSSEHGIPVPNISALTVDSRGLVWFGSIFAGAGCFDGRNVTSFTARNGLPHDHVVSIIEDNEGSIWVACLRGGLAQLDATGFAPVAAHPVPEAMAPSTCGAAWWGRQRTLVHYNGTTCRDCMSFQHQIQCILEDRQNRLWVGTGLELWLFPDARLPVRASGRIVAVSEHKFQCTPWNMHEDVNGVIWMADMNSGLHRYDEKLNTMVRVNQAAPFGGCTNLTSDGAGNMWLVGWNWRGVGSFDGTTVTKYTTADGLADNCTMTVAVDPLGTVWVGTGRGIAKLEGKRFKMYASDDELAGTFVQRLAIDRRGHLWAATLGGGVTRFDGKNFQILTTDDGLPSNCVTGIVEESDGSMLLSTYRGVCRYASDYSSAPQIQIVDIEADTVRKPDTLIRIPDSTPAIRIRYHGTSLKTRRIRYTYILEGYDARWNSTWSEEVRYERLPVGSYTFRVLAINRDMVYSRDAAVIQIDIVRDEKDEKLLELEEEIQTLKGMLPICSVCKRIRDGADKWERMETFITKRSQTNFSHGYCPECAAKLMEELERLPPYPPPKTAS